VRNGLRNVSRQNDGVKKNKVSIAGLNPGTHASSKIYKNAPTILLCRVDESEQSWKVELIGMLPAPSPSPCDEKS